MSAGLRLPLEVGLTTVPARAAASSDTVLPGAWEAVGVSVGPVSELRRTRAAPAPGGAGSRVSTPVARARAVRGVTTPSPADDRRWRPPNRAFSRARTLPALGTSRSRLDTRGGCGGWAWAFFGGAGWREELRSKEMSALDASGDMNREDGVLGSDSALSKAALVDEAGCRDSWERWEESVSDVLGSLCTSWRGFVGDSGLLAMGVPRACMGTAWYGRRWLCGPPRCMGSACAGHL